MKHEDLFAVKRLISFYGIAAEDAVPAEGCYRERGLLSDVEVLEGAVFLVFTYTGNCARFDWKLFS